MGGFYDMVQTNEITTSNHQGLDGSRHEKGLQTGLTAMKQKEFSTHWDWLNVIRPVWEHLRRNSSVKGVSLTQQYRARPHVRTPQTAVHTYTKPMQSLLRTARFINGDG